MAGCMLSYASSVRLPRTPPRRVPLSRQRDLTPERPACKQSKRCLPDGSEYEGQDDRNRPESKQLESNAPFRVIAGEMKDGRPDGFGRLRLADGLHYKGDFRLGRFEGRGVLEKKNASYWGEFKDRPGAKASSSRVRRASSEQQLPKVPPATESQDGRRHGRGCVRLPDGRVLTCNFVQGQAHGVASSASDMVLIQL